MYGSPWPRRGRPAWCVPPAPIPIGVKGPLPPIDGGRGPSSPLAARTAEAAVTGEASGIPPIGGGQWYPAVISLNIDADWVASAVARK
jgi:hypothetical protein